MLLMKSVRRNTTGDIDSFRKGFYSTHQKADGQSTLIRCVNQRFFHAGAANLLLRSKLKWIGEQASHSFASTSNILFRCVQRWMRRSHEVFTDSSGIQK